MRELVINSSIQHTLLLFIPLIFAFIFKRANVRSWSLFGGLVGGILLGPAIFGNMAPEYWEGIFQGGVEAHQAYIESVDGQDAKVETDTLFEAWETAKWEDQRTLRDYVIALVFLILLSGTMRSNVRGNAPPLMSLSVGVWAAIVPCGIVTMLSLWFLDVSLPVAFAFGACLATGPWTFTRWEQRTADESEQGGASLMLRCGRVAWLVASLVALYGAWQVRGAMALVWLLPLLLLPLVWCIPSRSWKWLTLFVDYAAIPSVMATTLVLIHPIDALAIWPIVFVIVLCADARWLGGIIGLGILGGRESENSMRLAIPLVDAGISQLCMASLLFGVGILPASLTLAVLLGAVFLDRTASIRMKFAQMS